MGRPFVERSETISKSPFEPTISFGVLRCRPLKGFTPTYVRGAKIDNCIEEETSTKGNLQIDFG